MRLPLSAWIGLTLLTSEVLLSLTKRSRGEAQSRDAKSLRLIWIVVGAAIFLGFQALGQWRDARLPRPDLCRSLGVVLFVLGLALRWYAIMQLGRFFTVNVAIATDHQLVDTGPYRFVRHPSYTGALVAFLGFALTLGNWAALLVMIVPICWAFIYRINIEERALVSALGERYVAYTRRTKRLVPFVY
jgi:protein-S-isoprenylcysteine O-methyltransferase Ste14